MGIQRIMLKESTLTLSKLHSIGVSTKVLGSGLLLRTDFGETAWASTHCGLALPAWLSQEPPSHLFLNSTTSGPVTNVHIIQPSVCHLCSMANVTTTNKQRPIFVLMIWSPHKVWPLSVCLWSHPVLLGPHYELLACSLLTVLHKHSDFNCWIPKDAIGSFLVWTNLLQILVVTSSRG